jgi:hypothetical protein
MHSAEEDVPANRHASAVEMDNHLGCYARLANGSVLRANLHALLSKPFGLFWKLVCGQDLYPRGLSRLTVVRDGHWFA